MRTVLILLQLLFLSGIAFANPSGINLSGKISLQASGTALTAADVDFKIRVLSPDGCILYSEKFLNVDLSATAGVFNLTIGNGTALYNAWDATLGTANSKASLIKVFNNGSVPIASGLTQYPGEVCAGGAYTPADGDTRKVVIEFDPTGTDNSANYVALSPFHRIRSVPYAMLADKASDSDKLGGLAASTYAKNSDLAAAVPAAETDPSVQAFAKTAITGLTAGNCGAGKVLTYDGTSLVCVTDSGGGGGGSIATNTVAGTVLVDTGSNVSLNLTTGALDVKDLAISKITGLQTALDAKIGYAAMPATSCGAGEALVWLTPSNTFDCFAIAVAAGDVTGLDAAVDARIAADTTKLPVAGGTMTGDINMSNKQLNNVAYVHLQNKAADPGGLVAGNEGFVWYNSTDKQIKYYNGTAINALPAYTGACADGQILKWNNTLKVWACAADAGAGGGANATQIQGTNVSAVAPTAGQFLKYVGTDWTATSMPVCTASQVMLFDASGVATCTAISGLTDSSIAVAAAIARTKLASGTAGHVLINDGTGVMSSEAQLAVTRGGTGQSTYTDGQLLIGNSTGNTLTKGTLAQGAGITITNGNGTITIAADPTTATIADDSIVNADVNTAAAIDRTKLASGTANRVVINTTGGVMADAAAITAGRALISDVNGIPTHSTVTGTELSYVSGVTSAIQTQLDALTTGGTGKVAKAGDTMTGNLVMNAEKEVRFADADSDHFIGLKSPATVAADVTFTLPAADGTAGYVLKTDGAGNLAWIAPAAAPGDASYAAKGIVQFNTDAVTSGINVAAGVATVNTGLGAGQIVKLPTAGTLPVLNGSALTNLDVDAITSATGKYFKYAPNNIACSDGGVLKWVTANSRWECGTDAGAGGGVDAVTIRSAAVSVTTPTEGAFMKFTTGAWTPTFMPSCGADKTLTFDVTGAAACTTIGGLVNSQIDAAAAIARTKIASGTADHVLINNGSGVMSSEAQLAVTRGGTGQSTYTDGQLLIGNSTGNTLSKATLTQGTGITITNGSGTITIAADPVSSIVDGSIVDADVNATAAIARTKLANGTANRVVINTTGGVMSEAAAITADRALISDANGIPTHSTVTNTELAYVSGVTSAIQTQLDTLTTAASGKVAKAGDTMTGNLIMSNEKEVRFGDSGAKYIGLKSPTTVTGSSVTFTLPNGDGTSNQVLKTDGAGNLGWVALPAGTVDASYAAKGIVQLDTDLATSGLAVTAGVIKVNTGTGAGQIVRLPTASTLPALNGSALTNLDVAAITSASGKWLSYKPDGTECADGEILKWVAATDRWVCGTAADLGAVTSVVAGTGLDVNTVAGAATVSVEAELGALNGLSTTGYVQRTGAATYSTTTGNTLASNNTVVTRDGSGVSGFYGVGVTGSTAGTVILQAPTSFTNYTLTLPSDDGAANQVLKTDGAGALSWVTQSSGADNLGNHTATQNITLGSNYLSGDGQNEGIRIDASGNVGIGMATPFAKLDITDTFNGNGLIRLNLNDGGAFNPAVAAYSLQIANASINGHSTIGMLSATTKNAIVSKAVTATNGSTTIYNDTAGVMTPSLTSVGGSIGIGTETPGAKLDVKGAIRMSGATSGYTGFQPAAVAGSTVWTLPATDGTVGQVLKTDGSGVLGWVSQSAAPGDASYAAKGLVQLDTNLATSGIAVTAGVIKVNTGLGANQIVQLPTAGTLPVLNGSALTNIDVTAITSATGKWLNYMPNGIECADGEILKWVASTDRWICAPAGGTGTVTSIIAGTGLTGGTITASGTIGLGTELTGVNGLATTGYVQRTGAGTYSTTTGNTLNSNSTVVTRDGSGVSGFSGVLLNNASMNVTQVAPATGTSYSVTWPQQLPAGNGYILTSTTGGLMDWKSPSQSYTVDVNNVYASSSASVKYPTGADSFLGAQNIHDLNGTASFVKLITSNTSANDQHVYFGAVSNAGVSAWTPTMVWGTSTASGAYNERMRISTLGYLGVGTDAPGAMLDVKGAIRMSGSTSGYTGFQPAAAAGSTVWTLPATDGTSNQVLQTNGSGILSWASPAGAPADSSYAAKGIVQFNTDEATSGMTVASGVATVKRTTAALASTILQLDASSKAMVKGLDLKGTTNSVSILPLAGTSAYSLTLPSADGTAGQVLKTDGAGALGWVTPLTAVNSAAITDGSIMDADVNAAAAITRSKLANGSNWHVLINDGSGVMTSEANLAVSRGGTGNSSFTANSLVMSGATTTSALSALTCSTGQVPFYNGTTTACSTDFVAAAVASAVNYVLLTGSTGTSTVKVSAAGTGANLDLTLAAKGTGQVKTDSTLNVNGTYIERAPASTTVSGTTTGTNTLPTDRNLYRVTMSANTTLYLPACPAATDTSFSMTVKVAQSGAGGFVLAWGTNGGSVTWDSGTVPDASTATTTAVSIYQFLCFAGESNVWYGMQVWKQ
jgi:hypothetical protein